MKKTLITIAAIIFVLSLALNIIQCTRTTNIEYKTNTVTKTEIIPGDSIPYIVKIPTPYPIYKDTGSIYLATVDTFAIIKEFLTKNIYYRVIKDDSSAFIAIYDTVYKNKLSAGSLVFQNRKITAINTTNTTTVEPIKTVKSCHLYIGGIANISKNSGFSATGIFQDKKGNLYIYGYDPFNKFHHVGLGFSIF